MAEILIEGRYTAGADIRKAERDLKRLAKEAKAAGKVLKDTFSGTKINFAGPLAAATRILAGFGAGIIAVGKDFVTTNASMEQFNILLETATGSAEAADEAFDDIFDFANTAPFGIDALTDAFVKLKVSGLDPMDGTLRTLVDSVAAFGGTDDQLKLVTIAIQQMVGKGVVSMEELRRQFGEQVPTAMRAMARGLGLTMLEMVKLIETGGLEANRGIQAMITELATLHAGSAEARMESLRGAITRLKNEWTRFVVSIGKSGSLDSISASVIKVAESFKRFTQSVAGADVVASVSRDISKFFESFADDKFIEDAIRSVGQFTTEIVKSVAVLVEHKDAIFAFFRGIIKLAIEAASAVGNIFQSLEGWREVFDGNLNIIDFAGMSPQELTEYLRNLKDPVHQLNLQIEETERTLNQLTEKSGRNIIKADPAEIIAVRRHLIELKSQLYDLTHPVEGDTKIKIDVDVEEVNSKMTSFSEGVLQDLDKTNKEAHKKATEIASAYGEMITAVEKAIEESSQKIEKMQTDIVDKQRGFANDIRQVMRGGMTEDEAYRDQIDQINELEQAADQAYSEGRMEQYNKLLYEALDIAGSLSEVEYSTFIDDGTLEDAEKAQAIQDKMISSETLRANKIAEMSRIQDKIIESDKEQLEIEKEKKTALENTLTTYQQGLEKVQTMILEIEHFGEIVDSMWKRAADGVETEATKMESSVMGVNNYVLELLGNMRAVGQVDMSIDGDTRGPRDQDPGWATPPPSSDEGVWKPGDEIPRYENPDDNVPIPTSNVNSTIVNNFNQKLSKSDINDISTRQAREKAMI